MLGEWVNGMEVADGWEEVNLINDNVISKGDNDIQQRIIRPNRLRVARSITLIARPIRLASNATRRPLRPGRKPAGAARASTRTGSPLMRHARRARSRRVVRCVRPGRGAVPLVHLGGVVQVRVKVGGKRLGDFANVAGGTAAVARSVDGGVALVGWYDGALDGHGGGGQEEVAAGVDGGGADAGLEDGPVGDAGNG